MDADAASDIGAALVVRYRAIHAGAMRDMPVCNLALAVAAIGFRPFADNAAGIVITPWFMNLVIAGALARNLGPGIRLRVPLPAGDVDFVASALDGFGPLLACSLFSPMFDFPDMVTAEASAREAMVALFNPAFLDDARPAPPSALDRRNLLFGKREARP